MRISITTLAILLVIALVFGVGAQDTPAYDTPQAMLQSYFHAVNRGDYLMANNLRQDVNGYFGFVRGFIDTERAEVYLGDYDPATRMVQTVLVSEQTDGSLRTFVGCYEIGRGQKDVYLIAEGNLIQIETANAYPTPATLRALLTADCTRLGAGFPITTRPISDAERFLQGHIHAINTGAIRAADPLRGYGYITLYAGAYQATTQTLPVALIAETPDHHFDTYIGCYTLTDSAQGWTIVRADISLLRRGIPPGLSLVDALAGACLSEGG